MNQIEPQELCISCGVKPRVETLRCLDCRTQKTQSTYEYNGTAMVPTKWIGIRLTPRCEICEARGCKGHGQSEIELRAFVSDIPYKTIKDVKTSTYRIIPSEERAAYRAYLSDGSGDKSGKDVLDYIKPNKDVFIDSEEGAETFYNPYARTESIGASSYVEDSDEN